MSVDFLGEGEENVDISISILFIGLRNDEDVEICLGVETFAIFWSFLNLFFSFGGGSGLFVLVGGGGDFFGGGSGALLVNKGFMMFNREQVAEDCTEHLYTELHHSV